MCTASHAQVQASITRFEERLWSIIRNFMTISQERQWLLTDAVRIIETQERVDQHIRSAAEGTWCGVCKHVGATPNCTRQQ